MSMSTAHFVGTRKTCSTYYSVQTLVNPQAFRHMRDFQDGPFRYILRPRNPQEHKSVVTGFKLEIWVHKSLEGKADPVTNFTCRRAETITGTIGTTWINTSTGRLKSAMGDWGCRKVVQDQSDEGAETFKLFELWTENPLYLEKGTDSAWTFEIILLFQLPGSLHDQVATVSRALSSPTTPGPCSSFNNIAQHLSRPANLALNASSRPEEELPYVYLLQEALAAASPYLEGVVEAGYDTFATRSFDGRDDFDPVDDDSDDEEDTKRYNLMNEGELSGDEDEERRSEAPEPAKGKSEEEEPPAKKSKLDPEGEDSDEEEEDQEMAPAAPLPSLPPIFDTRAPHEGMMVINVPHCALSTLQAVVAFVLESHVVFAPLALEGKAQRTASINNVITTPGQENRPVPVSPRSVYRLAERFRLDELASVALENIKGKLTKNRAGYVIAANLALHSDCANYPQMKTLVHSFVRDNLAYMLGDLLNGPKGSIQDALLGELLRSEGRRMRYY